MALLQRAHARREEFWHLAARMPPRLAWAGCAILLQAIEEGSRIGIEKYFGPASAVLFSFLCISLSLVCLGVAVSPRHPRWLRGKARQIISRIVVLGGLATALGGLGELVYIGYVCFQPPTYYNDGALLDHNAALLLLHGQNPYTHSNIVAALRSFHQLATHTTPLQQGRLAGQRDYPSSSQSQALLANAPAGQTDPLPEFESRVSYPALAFLVLVPLVWAGAPTVIAFYLLCLFCLAFVGLRAAPRAWRWWVALLLLADVPVINETLDGNLDVFWTLLLVLAWLTARRWRLSALLLGLALACKQTPWLVLPFYAIYIYHYQGASDALRRVGLAGAVFLAINLPFIAMDAGAWAAGVLAPLRDPMYPQGAGLIVLSLANWLPLLPRATYSALEGVALLASLGWYWRRGPVRPEAAFLLAILPLFLAWRSLPSYFDTCALAVVFLLASKNCVTKSLSGSVQDNWLPISKQRDLDEWLTNP